jgi:hypothetical protein
MACDQVQLSEPAAEITVQDFEALRGEELRCEVLCGAAKRESCGAAP